MSPTDLVGFSMLLKSQSLQGRDLTYTSQLVEMVSSYQTFPPNFSGLISAEDIQVLQELTKLQRSLFTTNIASNVLLNASSIRGGNGDSRFSPYNIRDEGMYTYWSPEENQHIWMLHINLQKLVSFNVVKLQEPIQMGQRVIKFHLEVLNEDGVWKRVFNSTTIGYQRVLQFSTVTSQHLMLLADKSRADPLISYLVIYLDWFSILSDISDKSIVAYFNGSQVIRTTTQDYSQNATM